MSLSPPSLIQMYTAVYYVLADLLMLGMYFYYVAKNRMNNSEFVIVKLSAVTFVSTKSRPLVIVHSTHWLLIEGPLCVYNSLSKIQSLSTPNSTHCCSPGQTHQIHHIDDLMISWHVESGVLVLGFNKCVLLGVLEDWSWETLQFNTHTHMTWYGLSMFCRISKCSFQDTFVKMSHYAKKHCKVV